jgi:hypothetical protein
MSYNYQENVATDDTHPAVVSSLLSTTELEVDGYNLQQSDYRYLTASDSAAAPTMISTDVAPALFVPVTVDGNQMPISILPNAATVIDFDDPIIATLPRVLLMG